MNVRPHDTKQKTFVIKFWHKKRHYKKTTPAVSVAATLLSIYPLARLWREFMPVLDD